MKMLCRVGFTALLCLPVCIVSAKGTRDSSGPAALVYSLQGEATLTVPSEERRPLRLFDRLPAGATVEAGPGSRLALAFANGRRYELGDRSRATLGPADLSVRSGPVRPLPSVPPLPRLSPIAQEEQPGSRAGAVRIRAERITGLYPRRGAATLAGVTSLRFEPVEGGGKYAVEVHDRQGNVIFSTETTRSVADLSAGLLQPGLRYDWTVRTVERVGSVAKGEASFITLPRQTAEARKALQKAVEAAGDGASLALLAEVDRSLGMLIEAREELRMAVERSPEDAALAEELAGIERQMEDPVVPPAEQDARTAAWLQGRQAQALAEAKQWPEADAAWEAAVQRLEKSEPAMAAQLLRDWGETLQQRNEWDRAVEIYRRALRLTPEESLAAALGWTSLGTIASRRGDLAAAEEFFLKAYALRERLAPASLEHAESERNLAIVAIQRGQLEEAEARLVEALKIQERLAPESLDVAETLRRMGNIALIRGDLITADENYRRALVLLERLDPSNPLFAAVLGNRGVIDMTRGDLAVAEERFRRALAIEEKRFPESLEVAKHLNNLGIVAQKRGDLAAAEEHHRRALEIREKLARGSSDVAASLVNLGSIASNRGHLDEADEYFRRAYEIRERIAPDSIETARVLTYKALVAVERGDLDAAEQLHGRALAILEKQTPASLQISDSLESLGNIAFERRDLTRAESFYRRSLEIRERLAPGSTRMGLALSHLGQVHRELGHRELAARFNCAALDDLDRQREKLGGTIEGKSSFSGTASVFYGECIASLVEDGRPEEAFHTLERGRARSFLDLLSDRDLLSDLPPDLARERQEADAEYDRAQAALGRLRPDRDQAEIDRLLVQLRELRARQEEILTKVRQASPRAAALSDPQPFDLAAARSTLDPGTLLLGWSIGRKSSLLFAVLPSGAPGPGFETFSIPVDDATLRRRMASFRNLLQNADSDRTVLTAQARELYDLLLRPAEARIAAADRLLLLPDGALHTLPFAALVRDGRYLAEEKPIHTVLSATVYAELRKSRRQVDPGSLSLAAFGDPRYPRSARSARSARSKPGPAEPSSLRDPDVRAAAERGLALTPLPASREEVLDIAALFPQTKTFLGPEATEEQVKSVGKDVRYLHFACHGLLDERSPMNSALALTIPESPQEGRDNGLLQAWEIFERVRLDADLVTLSACDSALGSEMGGEGLLGLTRAFQYAGARSVLATLWSVSDISTAALMKRLYSQLRAGRSKDQALQAAQTALIRLPKYSHPYYWAAFQLTGDWK